MKWYLPYAGETYVFDDERVTAHEARLMKRITEGMTPVEIAGKRLQGDPDVFVAMLAVARERAGLDMEQALRIDDRQFCIEDCIDATTAAMKEQREAAADTPPPPAEAAKEEPKAPRRRKRPPVADAPPEDSSAA